MGGMKISELDFVRLLPAFMRNDEAVIALSKAVNKLVGEPCKRLSTLRTWDKIHELNEAECDELAWELDIDWYDSTGMSLEEKRATIEVAQQIKRKRGTKWAVERLISAYFGEGYVMEWYEMEDAYNTPFTFIVLTMETHITAENYVKFMEAANAAKNERSHIAGVFYFWEQEPSVECALGKSVHPYEYKKCGTCERVATVGFIVKPSIETEPEDTAHLYGYTSAGENTCGTYPQTTTKGAALKTGATTEPETALSMYNYVKCGEQGAVKGAVLKTEAATEPTAALSVYDHTKCGEQGFKAVHGAAIVGTAIVGRAIVTS